MYCELCRVLCCVVLRVVGCGLCCALRVVRGVWKSPRRHVAERRGEGHGQAAIQTWPNLPIASTERLGYPSRRLLKLTLVQGRCGTTCQGSGERAGPCPNVKGRPTYVWPVAGLL